MKPSAEEGRKEGGRKLLKTISRMTARKKEERKREWKCRKMASETFGICEKGREGRQEGEGKMGSG